MERERIVLGAGSRNAKVLAPPAILAALGAEVVAGPRQAGLRRTRRGRPAGRPRASIRTRYARAAQTVSMMM